MAQWTLDTPPSWYPTAVSTDAGWVDPDSGVVVVAINRLNSKAGAADVNSVDFGATTYAQGEDLSVIVTFNERVNVGAGASLVVGWTGIAGNITLKALAQTNVHRVVFDRKSSDGTTQETVPATAGVLSIGAQTISGTITDANSGVKASGVLTFDDNPDNTETITVGTKVYTFQTTLTNSDGNVKIGSTKEESMLNLHHAFNPGGSGSGVRYAAATTDHATVDAYAVGNQLFATAKTAGTAGNSIATEDTMADVKATGTVTFGSNPAAGKTVVIGTKTYTFKAGITDVAAAGTLTLTGNIVDTKTVTIGSSVYTFQDTLTDVANNVHIGATASDTLDNLIACINHDAGGGTLYATSSVAHPDVTAAAGTGDTLVVTAKVAGAAGNAIATTTDDTNASWGATTLAGGATNNVDGYVKIGADANASAANLNAAINHAAGGGTTYAALTTEHATISSTVLTNVVSLEADAGGQAFNVALTTDVAGATLSGATLTGGLIRGYWGAATLAGGSAGTVTNKAIGASDLPDDITVAA